MTTIFCVVQGANSEWSRQRALEMWYSVDGGTTGMTNTMAGYESWNELELWKMKEVPFIASLQLWSEISHLHWFTEYIKISHGIRCLHPRLVF